jgi:hypothetical protein
MNLKIILKIPQYFLMYKGELSVNNSFFNFKKCIFLPIANENKCRPLKLQI